MNIEHKPRFFKLIANVYAFYRQDFSEFAGSVWWQAMQPFDFDAVADALNRHCINPDSGQFMPKPADAVRMLKGSSLDSAMIAWSWVDKGIREVGTYESVVFHDALIHRVIADMGGWIALGMKNEDEWPFVAKEFQNRYKGYSSRNERPEYPKKLLGMAEAQNTQLGFRTMPPRLIGDPERARLVFQQGAVADVRQVARLEDAAAAVAALMIESASQASKDAA